MFLFVLGYRFMNNVKMRQHYYLIYDTFSIYYWKCSANFKKFGILKSQWNISSANGISHLSKNKAGNIFSIRMRANQWTREFKRNDVYIFLVSHVKHTSGTKHVAIKKLYQLSLPRRSYNYNSLQNVNINWKYFCSKIKTLS